ncbi:MAG: hypothetical protein V9G12_01235 [Microthrixaceae bacterium]
MARVNEATTIPTGTRPSVRSEFTRYGRRWSSSITQLIALSVELDDSGEWALDGSPTCAHWIAATLDIEIGTAREWLRIGRALAHLPMTTNAFTNGGLSFTMRLTPARAAVLTAAVDEHVMRSDGREPADPTDVLDPTERAATTQPRAVRESHPRWASLAQQRVDALIDIISAGGTNVVTEVILHVRADGCTLDDGTPIGGSIVERIADTSTLRAMIHDAESHPINVSGRHRHHTKRQKLVVKERDQRCVDCGSTDFLEHDHVPDFNHSKRTLVEETQLRCSRCHTARHRRDGTR